MFDSLLKPKFYKKGKTCVDCIKSRMETIRKKRKAVEKFLKKDIADLLKSGLDYNAYGRAEGLLMEQNMSSCYELVVNYIKCISDHLLVLSKESNCPDECKEAVQSLIHAAARFADLPELRNLRTLFMEKFGDSLQPYISKEFVAKLKLESTQEMKIQILHDIAQEFSIKWDSKALKETLNRPSPLLQEMPKHKSLNMKQISSKESWRLQSNNISDHETSTDISSQDGPKTCSSSLESVSEKEIEYNNNNNNNNKRPSPSHKKINVPLHPYLKKPDNKGENKEESNSNQEKPKPRSVRTRGLKTSPAGPNTNVPESDSRDEEEKIMDELLMHYSKKRSPYEPEGRNTIRYKKIESDHGQLTRGTSLPSQLPSCVEPKMLGEGTRRHVHPKLPDYDDLTARLAAIKGR
ncbi:bile acid:Na+ symporter [Senna tora]|uniref:Bile acid:Na+ symporter n=1 Tax=Senna tora TaxID=362788 RepID=A0A835CIA0_9FABA|nr:bile acid:Na+ symporter [Senna tora]